MRLLHIERLELKYFPDREIPGPYLTTSHRWYADQESTKKDVDKKRNLEKRGYHKIEGFCRFAKSWAAQTGSPLEWIWVDTCCIDKKSSAEVTQSINAMCKWYKSSAGCLAYLADVRPLSAGMDAVLEDFKRSEWFTRGWTLQELLAPPYVIFLTRDWEVIGQKSTISSGKVPPGGMVLNYMIADITRIPLSVIHDYDSRRTYEVNVRMSWAQGRVTTEEEDEAYCLLGMFDVHLAFIPAEGRQNAFRRLWDEIQRF